MTNGERGSKLNSAAVNSLESLGLKHYEAELFAALTKLIEGSVNDICRISQIPRSRVYDTAQSLARKGLLEIHRTRPITYRAVAFELALKKLRSQQEGSFQRAEDALRGLMQERSVSRTRRGEFWIITGLENVSTRTEEMLRGAKRSILISLLWPQLLTDEIRDLLRRRAKTGLHVIVASPRKPLLDDLKKAVPRSTAMLLPAYEDETGTPGRLVIIDKKELLLSVLGEEDLPGIPQETAIWSDAPGLAATVSLFVAMAAKGLKSGKH